MRVIRQKAGTMQRVYDQQRLTTERGQRTTDN
jgi:hypothetical protein